MFGRLRSNPVTWFLVSSALLLSAWFLLYEFVINPQGWLDRPVIGNLILLTSLLLRLLGYHPIEQSFNEMRTIGVDGTTGVWIGDPCDGLPLFAVFAIIIICFPGPWRKKAWFIAGGILLLHIMNVLRITALSIMQYYSPALMNFNHTYTFQLLMYALIFFLWLRWINRHSGIKLYNTSKK